MRTGNLTPSASGYVNVGTVATAYASGVFDNIHAKVFYGNGANITGINTGIVSGSQEYTTGSGNWICPSGVTKVFVTMVGGGGDGGNGAATASNIGGGGGSSGGHLIDKSLTVIPGNSYAYSVGAAHTATTFSTLTAPAGVNGVAGAASVSGIGGVCIAGLSSDGFTAGTVWSGLFLGGTGGASIYGPGGTGGQWYSGPSGTAGSSPAAGSYGAGGGGGGSGGGGAGAGAAGLGGYILIQW